MRDVAFRTQLGNGIGRASRQPKVYWHLLLPRCLDRSFDLDKNLHEAGDLKGQLKLASKDSLDSSGTLMWEISNAEKDSGR